MPLFGLRRREVEPAFTSGELKQQQGAGETVASMVGPVITPANLDHTNRTQCVLYFSPDQINLVRKSPSVVPLAIYGQYVDSLPNLTNRPVGATAAYYLHLVENVLAGRTPKNPVDFNLLAAQAMENSFMVSGMVLGGHETLFHALFDEAVAKGLATHKMSDMFHFFRITRLGAGGRQS